MSLNSALLQNFGSSGLPVDIGTKAKRQTWSIELSASGQIRAAACRLAGFYVIASTSLVIKIREGGSAGTVKVGGTSGVAVAQGANINLFDLNLAANSYLEVVSGSGTLCALGEDQ
jgi:hypothetical protein